MHFSIDNIAEVAGEVIAAARSSLAAAPDHATLITFSGDLGAGKTTLIQEIARQLGIAEALQSPTYVIYKRYELQGQDWSFLVHGDMYRLESSGEIDSLGWDDLLKNPQNILCIEWPEKIQDRIPVWAVQVRISHKGGETRNIDLIA